MFYGCKKLVNLDLANFSTDKIANMLDMFGECYALAEADDSNFNSNTLKIFKLAQIFSLYKNAYM
jgi:surface protein